MTYQGDKFAPTLLVVAVGGSVLATMLWFLGINVVTKWFFYPSALLWFFSLRCLVSGRSQKWDRSGWKLCQWWSGIWSAMFILSFSAPLFSSLLAGIVLAPIAVAGWINPFLAAFAHILIWACTLDILQQKRSDNEESEHAPHEEV